MMTFKVSKQTKVNSIAGAIVNEVKNNGEAKAYAVGPFAVNQMIKGLATAYRFGVEDGVKMESVPEFSTVEINGRVTNCICITITRKDDAT